MARVKGPARKRKQASAAAALGDSTENDVRAEIIRFKDGLTCINDDRHRRRCFTILRKVEGLMAETFVMHLPRIARYMKMVRKRLIRAGWCS